MAEQIKTRGRPAGSYTKWSPERLSVMKSLRLRGYSMAEIAEFFDEPINAVKGAMQRKVGFPTRKDIAKSAWQPIETAPKNGLAVMLFSEGWGHAIGHWNKRQDNLGFWYHDGYEGYPIDFTHWMPLPEKPK